MVAEDQHTERRRARLLVTGAAGFIGQHVVARLAHDGYYVRAFTTTTNADFPQGVHVVRGNRNADEQRWDEAVDGMSTVVHLAGRAHVLRESIADPLEEFRRVNVRATVQLAHRAVAAGIRRFILISSIGVNGSSTCGAAFTEAQSPHPVEPYAISKYEAEVALRAIEKTSGLEVTVLRLPLVYGPGVKGNFLRLLQLVNSGIPLPLASINNLRSYLGVENFCDFLSICVQHPAAAGELFLLADGEDISTPDLIARLAAALDRPDRIFRFPPALLHGIAAMVGKGAELQRLAGSLQVDATRARTTMEWSPRTAFDVGAAAMADWFVSYSRGRLRVRSH